MFFKKKLEVFFNSTFERNQIEKNIKRMPNNLPSYFKTIPTQLFNLQFQKMLPFQRTVKTCPGYVNLFKRSFLICNPIDTYIEFNDQGIVFQKNGGYDEQRATVHPDEHLLRYVPNKHDYKFILKYHLPFSFKSDVAYISMDPGYHFTSHTTLPGIVPSNWFNEYNIFIPIRKEQTELYMREGEPLTIIVPLTEKSLSLSFTEKPEGHIDKSISYKFSNFKKFLLKNVLS